MKNKDRSVGDIKDKAPPSVEPFIKRGKASLLIEVLGPVEISDAPTHQVLSIPAVCIVYSRMRHQIMIAAMMRKHLHTLRHEKDQGLTCQF